MPLLLPMFGRRLQPLMVTCRLYRRFSNSRRPSQADEEAHQLSYLKKHMANILSLLAEPVEGEGEGEGEGEREREEFCPWKDLSTLDFFFNLVTKDLK
uniref:Uncharacterized protein n=1 Tax=Salix viminalis TaxID=40686 RepID=A0A6N2K0I0_SALVM